MNGSPLLILVTAFLTTLAGGVAKEGKWPSTAGKSIVGFLGLMVIFTALATTRIRPVIIALTWLIFLGSLYGAVPVIGAARARNEK